MRAVEQAGYSVGTDIAFALDVAATEFHGDGGYAFEGKTLSADDLTDVLRRPGRQLPDRLASRTRCRRRTGTAGSRSPTPSATRCRSSATTCSSPTPTRLADGIARGAANALLVKVNQIGTLTETLDAVNLAHRSGYRCMMSHRSGETEDTTIADLAVATDCGQIKTGAPARSERVAKYNQLLRIEEELDDAARYAGAAAFPRLRRRRLGWMSNVRGRRGAASRPTDGGTPGGSPAVTHTRSGAGRPGGRRPAGRGAGGRDAVPRGPRRGARAPSAVHRAGRAARRPGPAARPHAGRSGAQYLAGRAELVAAGRRGPGARPARPRRSPSSCSRSRPGVPASGRPAPG